MSDSNVSILDQYRAKPEKEDSGDSSEYKAYGIDAPRNRTPMIRIEYPEGTRGLMAKHYLVEVICTSSQYLSLIFTTGIVTLEGENLDSVLLEKLQEEEIRSLHCFNPKRHKPPPVSEPIITKIRRTGIKGLPKEKTGS